MAGIEQLTPKQVEHAKKPLGDGGNLWVFPEGRTKLWFFRYTIKGRARQMGLGSYPDVSLSDARDQAATYRKLLKQRIDPIAHREAERKREALEAERAINFTQCAARHIRAHRRGWKNAKHARQWVSTLKTYARPIIGTIPVADIGTEDVLRILQPIWNTKTETAKRVQGRVENILDFAAAHKWRDQMNPARWRGHLDKLLPKPSHVKTVKHHPAMPYAELPAFMDELVERDGISALALRFLILTATRTSETLNAPWTEIDLETRIWTIPKERMKKGKREHRVPLSGAAVSVLETLPRIDGNPHVFPGARYGRPLSDMALLELMRGMGYGVAGNRGDYVPHGFRSSLRDWSGEVSSFPGDVAEMALAHAIKNKVEAAYRRGDLFMKRRAMMEAWAEWCSRGKAAEVTPINEPASNRITSNADALRRTLDTAKHNG